MTAKTETKKILVAGSSGAIGTKMVEAFTERGNEVITLSSKPGADLTVDLTDSNMIEKIRENLVKKDFIPELVICCSGFLHDGKRMPEKNILEFDKAWLTKNIDKNVIAHIHLSQALDTLLTKNNPIIWGSLSAMVGSIKDNYLGGWYSYRMSKCALNMFIKSLSIEWKRKNKANKVLAIHPGTTKSAMSEPFNVRKDKLYQPELSASRIIKVLDNAEKYDSGQFINWSGESLPW